VKPDLVAQVRYTEMTDEGRLRHPAYLGLRDDKNAFEASGNRPRASGTGGKSRTVPAGKGSAAARKSRGAGAAATGALGDSAALLEQLVALEHSRKDGRITLPDGDTLEVTNLHKVFWPEIKRTKGDLLRHYARVAPLILPVIADRPLVMKRLPNGVNGKAFYQHRAPEPVPPGVRIETLPNDDVPARLVGGSLKTLLYMAQIASISMDPFFSKMTGLDHSDQVAIDLDPQPGATFAHILDVARWVHEILERVHVRGYPKTSGSEGLHIFIPLPPGTPYEAGMLFCQIVATMVATQHPKVATVQRMVNRRKDGTIYVDYLQNIQGKTLACAYSARASAFAGVSTPLTWQEVHDGRPSPQDFTIDTIAARVASVGDLWAKVRMDKGANLLAAIDRLS
jgi:bifunctional non-homologous end joining protein LigD